MDEELVENTRRNATLGKEMKPVQVVKEDPVKATLARFVPTPRRRAGPASAGQDGDDGSVKPPRQSMDVDAFKRLLLTGTSDATPSPPPAQAKAAVAHSTLTSDSSSSTADTASLSQQSLFDQLIPAPSETPRTSYELESEEPVASEQDALLPRNVNHVFKKPALPKSRQPNPPQSPAGSLRDGQPGLSSKTQGDLNKPLPPPPITNTFPSIHDTDEPTTSPSPAQPRQRPPPPLARRSSQRRASSYEDSLPSTPTSPIYSSHDGVLHDSQSEHFAKTATPAPPPPPSRRAKRMSNASQLSAQITLPEADEERTPILTSEPLRLSPTPSMSSLSNPRPQPPPSRQASLAKRQSRIPSGSPVSGQPPPPPPPRRARASSRGSVDSQSILPFADAGSLVQSPNAQSDVSSQSKSTDILADLVALQQEVDALRDRQKLPPNG